MENLFTSWSNSNQTQYGQNNKTLHNSKLGFFLFFSLMKFSTTVLTGFDWRKMRERKKFDQIWEDDNVTEWQQLNKNGSSKDIYKEAIENTKIKRLNNKRKRHSQHQSNRECWNIRFQSVCVENAVKTCWEYFCQFVDLVIINWFHCNWMLTLK